MSATNYTLQPLGHFVDPQIGIDVGDDVQSYDHTYFDTTVSYIRAVVEEDIEMAAPVSATEVYLIVDTNILLHHFDVLCQFTADIESQNLPLAVVIPRAVLDELDRQKNRKDLAWFARRATTWILEKAKERRIVRGQRADEILQDDASRQSIDPLRINDMRILDCALYFTRQRPGVAFLCTHDKNLRANGAFEDVRCVEPAPRWSSRALLLAMFPGTPHAPRFAEHQVVYRPHARVGAVAAPPTRRARAGPGGREADDGMDVDEEGGPAEVLLPSHALDSLHLQVIDHFRRVLLGLALRLGGGELVSTAAARSAYAPAYAKKAPSEWTAADALQFLGQRQQLPRTRPPMELFFAFPYSTRGARRGQDWPRQAWEEALGGMARVGEVFGERGVGESLSVLAPHCAIVFATPMRPTGM